MPNWMNLSEVKELAIAGDKSMILLYSLYETGKMSTNQVVEHITEDFKTLIFLNAGASQ